MDPLETNNALKLFQLPHSYGARGINKHLLDSLNKVDVSSFLKTPFNSGIERIQNYNYHKTPS